MGCGRGFADKPYLRKHENICNGEKTEKKTRYKNAKKGQEGKNYCF